EAWLRARRSPPSPDDLRPLVDPVLDALDYVHGNGLVHRDVKPDNIMIAGDGRPVLIDFGALKMFELRAAAEERATRGTTFAVATPYYAPPEQYEKTAKLGPPADVYGIAAVLYRAFCGRPPEHAEERTRALAKRLPAPYAPVATAARVPLPAPVTQAIDRALSYGAEDRPQSISELRAGLGWEQRASVVDQDAAEDAQDRGSSK